MWTKPSDALGCDDSRISDGDSSASSCEEVDVKKTCPSGGSIVTCDEAVSKLEVKGENKGAEDRNISRRAKRRQRDGQLGEQDTNINTTTGSAGRAWTEDKHCSYLNSIEATFVRSLYEQDYHAVDLSEQDQDCVESRPTDSNYLTFHGRSELFTSMQRGCYDQREYYRPHYIFSSSAPAVFASPWVQHFTSKMVFPPVAGGATQDVTAGQGFSPLGFAEGAQYSMEEVRESETVLPEVVHGSEGWSNRFQSHLNALNASTSAPLRPEASSQAKKWNLEPCIEVKFRSKRHKSTQEMLAETDLELYEQFLLDQELEQKPKPFDLNLKQDVDTQDTREGKQQLNLKQKPFDLNLKQDVETQDTREGGYSLREVGSSLEAGGFSVNAYHYSSDKSSEK